MSLRQHLENPASPLRHAFKEHLPRLAASMRSTWKPAMAGSEPIQAPDGQPADVLGHAISERLIWTRSPLSTPASPLLGADQLLSAGASSSVISALDALAADPAPENTDRAARAAVLIGLLDRAVRNGSALAEAWYEPLFTVDNLDDALATVPGLWAADVQAITERSAPLMASLQGSVTPGPTFPGSRAVGGADADLIIGSCVVEIKATRAPELRLRDAQQVIGYALLDFDDTYGLSQAAALSARYGRLVVWDLEELLDQAGGLSLAQARHTSRMLWSFLGDAQRPVVKRPLDARLSRWDRGKSMKADALNPRELFGTTVHDEIPAFQRPYVLSLDDQWQALVAGHSPGGREGHRRGR